MRRLSPILLVPLAVLFVLVGCDPNANPIDVNPPASEEDAATLIGAALAGTQATAGLTAQLQEIVTVAKGGPLPKITASATPQVDTTIVLKKADGLYTYDYTLHLMYEFVSPNVLTAEFSMKGTYDTPAMASDDSSAGAIEVTNILAGDHLTFNGTYDRFGTQQIKNEDQDAFESRINARLANVNVSRTAGLPVSGTITCEVSISHIGGAGVGFISVVSFHNDETATITINTKSFTVNLRTGTVVPG